MKYVIFVLTTVILAWGLWIIFDERADKQALYSSGRCIEIFNRDTEAMNTCSNSAWKSASELEGRANTAVIIGGIGSVLSGFVIWVQKKNEDESSVR
jgi:hypothetical protein